MNIGFGYYGQSDCASALVFTYLKRRTLFKTFFPKAVLLLFGASLGQWLGDVCFLNDRSLDAGASFDGFCLSMFVIATLIGMLTMVPGGMGTFDVLMILGLSQLGIDRSQAVVWLLYYRLFYYVTPFMTGVILFLQQAGMKVNQFLIIYLGYFHKKWRILFWWRRYILQEL